jgi:hypothetical protein
VTVVGGNAHHARAPDPRRRSADAAVAALILGVSLLVATIAGLTVLDVPASAPPSTEAALGPSTEASPWASADPSPLPSASPSEVVGSDPADLPRYPGSVRWGYEAGVDGRVRWVLIRYAAAATTDRVRAHYRTAMRDHGWFVGDVDFRDGVWRFDANRDSREVTIEIVPEHTSTLVTAYLTDLVERATPAPRADRPRGAPRPPDERRTRPDRPPRDGDDDDDDGGDDDGDD